MKRLLMSFLMIGAVFGFRVQSNPLPVSPEAVKQVVEIVKYLSPQQAVKVLTQAGVSDAAHVVKEMINDNLLVPIPEMIRHIASTTGANLEAATNAVDTIIRDLFPTAGQLFIKGINAAGSGILTWCKKESLDVLEMVGRYSGNLVCDLGKMTKYFMTSPEVKTLRTTVIVVAGLYVTYKGFQAYSKSDTKKGGFIKGILYS